MVLQNNRSITSLAVHGGNLAKDIANLLATTETSVEKLTVHLRNQASEDEEEEEESDEEEEIEKEEEEEIEKDEEAEIEGGDSEAEDTKPGDLARPEFQTEHQGEKQNSEVNNEENVQKSETEEKVEEAKTNENNPNERERQERNAEEEEFYGTVAEALRKAPVSSLKLIVCLFHSMIVRNTKNHTDAPGRCKILRETLERRKFFQKIYFRKNLLRTPDFVLN